VRGWTGPISMLALVGITALAARVGRAMLPFVLATIPLVASILVVNTFLYPGASDAIVKIGPLAPTWTGLTAALQATMRVVAFALSVAVFSLTTPTDDFLTDLELRGLGRRGAFIIGAAIRMVPRMVERAGEIADAQRARGLDTQGSVWRRVRGVLPLAVPMIFGALSEVEEQTLALEARAFSAPGQRTVVRLLADRSLERLARWMILILTVALVALSIAGRLPWP
jgi:energy-coupling factor transport system permease protein